jgi:hypothetical protein
VGRKATASVTFTIIPSIEHIAVTADLVQIGTEITVNATFSDPDSGDTHTAVWNWGDGTTSEGTVIEPGEGVPGSVTGTHTYTSPGVYTLTLTITDGHDIPASATYKFIVVYDPNAGFVTGGGWITSPPGAYVPDPSLTGKANFGFVSRYQKGAKIPTGETEFQFKVANLNFHSDSYDWLVVAGARAQYKGTGTINNAGTYGFMLTAIDGAINGGGGTDKFRIKIWDKATGDVVYDNQLEAPEDAEPTTVIGGGSIVIHK